jgi:hypothetical protein
MPTYIDKPHCAFPEHHAKPSGGPGLGWLAALIIGAVVIAFWRDVLIALAVVAVLAVAGVPVLLLMTNHRRHYDPELEQAAALEQQRQAAAALAAQQRPALERPAVHHHLHLHGVTPDAAAEIIRRQQLPAAEETRPW